MLDRIERYRTPLLFLTGLVLAALVWALMERAHDAAQPLELIATDAPPGGLKVEVGGAVNIPGVYQFEPGARIADAINAAGGPAVDASLSSLDLATRLRDEQRIVVPTREEAVRRAATTRTSGDSGGLIDLNSADAALLETLPGIGTVRARNIVDSRASDGPFASIDDVVSRGLVPRSVLDDIRADVVALPRP